MQIAITGVSSGIGAATAKILKEKGANVTGFDIVEPAENVDRWIEMDMSDRRSIAAGADAADGPFDALLNIAGLPPKEGMTETVLQVNYFGLIEFSRLIHNKLNPGASIVNLASRAGSQWLENIEQVKAFMALENPDKEQLASFSAKHSVDHVRAYNLTKEAVIVWSMAQTEAMIAKGLRMNSVSPAAVSTGILDDFKNAFGVKVDHAIARVGRPGNAEEIAELVAFLAGPESGWIKGNDILIDGGMSALATTEALGLPELGLTQ